jgi:hypothetical protein
MRFRHLFMSLILLNADPALAMKVLVSVNEHSQQMTVSVDGQQLYVWSVSTGITRYATPIGTYTPFRMEEDHFSEEWDDAPMPHSIFFTPWGHAIHGTEYINHLGHRASHGCVRIAPENAEKLYSLVEEAGLSNTTVVIKGSADNRITQKPARGLVKKPMPRLVEQSPQLPVKNAAPRLVESPQQLPAKRARYPRNRRQDDPFLWPESLN